MGTPDRPARPEATSGRPGSSGDAAVVARPVGLHQVPLGGCPADQAFQLGRQQLGAALHVVAAGGRRAASRSGGRMTADVRRGARLEVHRAGQQRRAGPQGQGDRAGRQLGALAEEVDLHPGRPADQAVGEQAQQVVGSQGPAAGRRRPLVRSGSPACPAAPGKRRTSRTRRGARAPPPRPRWDDR